MRSEEFLQCFRDALVGNVSERVIQENINYYNQYIRSQMAAGVSESEVLSSLGNPRLLAKTIIETNKFAQEGDADSSQQYSDTYENSYDYSGQSSEQNYPWKSFQLHGLLGGIVSILIIAIVIGLVFCVISYLAPLILTGIAVICIYRLVKRYLLR